MADITIEEALRGGCWIRVTSSEEYFFDGHCSVDEVVKGCFAGNLGSYHAWRDGSRIGNSKKPVSVLILAENGKRLPVPTTYEPPHDYEI